MKKKITLEPSAKTLATAKKLGLDKIKKIWGLEGLAAVLEQLPDTDSELTLFNVYQIVRHYGWVKDINKDSFASYLACESNIYPANFPSMHVKLENFKDKKGRMIPIDLGMLEMPILSEDIEEMFIRWSFATKKVEPVSGYKGRADQDYFTIPFRNKYLKAGDVIQLIYMILNSQDARYYSLDYFYRFRNGYILFLYLLRKGEIPLLYWYFTEEHSNDELWQLYLEFVLTRGVLNSKYQKIAPHVIRLKQAFRAESPERLNLRRSMTIRQICSKIRYLHREDFEKGFEEFLRIKGISNPNLIPERGLVIQGYDLITNDNPDRELKLIVGDLFTKNTPDYLKQYVGHIKAPIDKMQTPNFDKKEYYEH
jgi:hypothetical protein